MTDPKTPEAGEGSSEILLYQGEDGRARIEVRLEGGTVWLTQRLMAELYQTFPQNITLHLKQLSTEGEMEAEATCKELLQVRRRGRPATGAVIKDSLMTAADGSLAGFANQPRRFPPAGFRGMPAVKEQMMRRGAQPAGGQGRGIGPIAFGRCGRRKSEILRLKGCEEPAG